MSDKKNQFVAVSAVWFERYLECSRTHGTEFFPKSVWRFKHSLLNLGEDKLAVKDIVDKHITEVWEPYFNEQLKQEYKAHWVSCDADHDISSRRVIHKYMEENCIVSLYEFIIQAIQNSGVGWPTQEQFETFTYSRDVG